MKKRILALLCAVVMCLSVFAVSASAAPRDDGPGTAVPLYDGPGTQDSYYTYKWSDSTSRYDYCNARTKYSTYPIYVRTEYSTLPYNGYYVKPYYGTTDSSAKANPATWTEYKINDYLAHTVNPAKDIVSPVNLINKYVCLRGHYTNTTYSWGDCKIAWSPDTNTNTGETLYPLN